jgi:methionine-rich copper-binding protein CopC
MKQIFISISIILLLTFTINCQSKIAEQKATTANPEATTSNPKVPLDTVLNGFKGKVKTVTIEEAKIVKKAGKFVELKRRTQEKADYDENGYLKEKIDYEDSSKNTYQFIGGDKTIKVSFFDPPNVGNSPVTSIRALATDQSDKPTDPRFNTRFKYEFDEAGRVKEEIIYLSNGDLWLREVFSYDSKGLRNKIARFEGNGNKPYEQIFTFDSNGNEIEMKYDYPEPDEEDAIFAYSDYQFDTNGNWTKRTKSEVTIKKGKRIVTSMSVAYRTITYYEN